MRNLKLTLAYDGTVFHGWQVQPRLPTVQGTLQAALEKLFNHSVNVTGSGRTDAGVHAFGQVCHFLTDSTIAPDALRKGLNSLLPDDILIKEVEDAPAHFHARYSARSKVYEYRILNTPQPDPFLRFYIWHLP